MERDSDLTADDLPKVVEVHVAEKIRSEQYLPGVDIRIRKPLRRQGEESEDVLRRFEEDALILFNALREALPGGTLDRLAMRLLDYIASKLTVSRPAAQEGDERMEGESFEVRKLKIQLAIFRGALIEISEGIKGGRESAQSLLMTAEAPFKALSDREFYIQNWEIHNRLLEAMRRC